MPLITQAGLPAMAPITTFEGLYKPTIKNVFAVGYDMTNAVPNSDARWLTAQDMRGWLGEARDGDVIVSGQATAPAEGPGIAYLDLGTRFP